jgi:hypothetical protein
VLSEAETYLPIPAHSSHTPKSGCEASADLAKLITSVPGLLSPNF